MAQRSTITIGFSDPPLGNQAAWPDLDPALAPGPGHGGRFLDGYEGMPIVRYQVEGDWRREARGRLFRWHRIEYENGQELVDYQLSPAGQASDGEQSIGPYLALVFVGVPLAIGTAAILVVTGVSRALPAAVGTLAGIVGGAVVGVALHESTTWGVRRFEAPGNLLWRLGAPAWRMTGILLWLMPAVGAAAASVALARLSGH